MTSTVAHQPALQTGGIVILDYGSQYTQIIARRVREQNVYAEILPWDADLSRVNALAPRGLILSGGPSSVYDPGAPTLPGYMLDRNIPILGICYGMQALTHALGGTVAGAQHREYGPATLEIKHGQGSTLFDGLPDSINVWMSHGDRIEALPAGWTSLGHSHNSPYAAMGDEARRRYGVQFHPEVAHTPLGAQILRNFVLTICGCEPRWTPASIIEESIHRLSPAESVSKTSMLRSCRGMLTCPA
jgi:GMP synthase (glutamine-hydrolysing)